MRGMFVRQSFLFGLQTNNNCLPTVEFCLAIYSKELISTYLSCSVLRRPLRRRQFPFVALLPRSIRAILAAPFAFAIAIADTRVGINHRLRDGRVDILIMWACRACDRDAFLARESCRNLALCRRCHEVLS